MRRRVPLAAVPMALVGLALAATGATAHPLGNFTVNHYTGIRVAPTGVALDVVVDLAEIPTFQARLELDTDGDGDVSDAEAAAARAERCAALTPDLQLTIDRVPALLTLRAAGLEFPHGAGGLPTLRLVCEFESPFATPLTGSVAISYRDAGGDGRLGWREIVVVGDGTTIVAADGSAVMDRSTSARLTSYPADRLTTPLDVRAVTFAARPGGARLGAFVAPDAVALGPAADPAGAPRAATPASPRSGAVAPSPAAVPGGVGAELPDVLRTAELTPLAALLSLLAAIGLGAAHAVTPGHGKTLIAAYLVAARGHGRQAVGLGLAVSLSHTLGVLVLAALVVGAQSVVAPDAVERATRVGAAILTVALGGWMLAREARRRAANRGARPHDHPHPEPAAADRPITGRGLAAVGLAGGLVPSASALYLLLLAVALGRAAWGLVLVLAFGVGMALVMAGIGLAVVRARGLVARLPLDGAVARRVADALPLAASAVVVVLGLWLTGQALGGSPVF